MLPLLFHTPDESDSPYFAQNLAADEAAAKVGPVRSYMQAIGRSQLAGPTASGAELQSGETCDPLANVSLPAAAPSLVRFACLH